MAEWVLCLPLFPSIIFLKIFVKPEQMTQDMQMIMALIGFSKVL